MRETPVMTDWTRDARRLIDQWAEAQSAWWHAETVAAWRESAYRVVDAHAHVEGWWTDAQRKAWQDALARASGFPDGGSGDGRAAGERMIASLTEAAEDLVRAQADWARVWHDETNRQ